MLDYISPTTEILLITIFTVFLTVFIMQGINNILVKFFRKVFGLGGFNK